MTHYNFLFGRSWPIKAKIFGELTELENLKRKRERETTRNTKA
jgi:hypothetical protein